MYLKLLVSQSKLSGIQKDTLKYKLSEMIFDFEIRRVDYLKRTLLLLFQYKKYISITWNTYPPVLPHFSARKTLVQDLHLCIWFLSILFYPITLEGRQGTTDEFATIPFHLGLFSAALVELAKSIPVLSLILSSHLFFCLPLFLFPFTVPCRMVFAKPEDLETWPNHLRNVSWPWSGVCRTGPRSAIGRAPDS